MQRSSVDMLPEEVRKELEQRLLRGNFTDYAGLAQWLKEQGFEISKSSVHRFGSGFEERLRALKVATDQAKAIATASEDDAGAMNEALIRLVQTKTFELLVDLDVDDKNLAKVGVMVAKLARAAVSQKKWGKEIEAEVRKRALDDAAKAVDSIGKKKGSLVDPETLRVIKEEIYGIV